MVRCTHCNTIYSLGDDVKEVIARYADCDVFRSPCCNRIVDSRPWKTFPDYERVDAWELRQVRSGRNGDLYGRLLR